MKGEGEGLFCMHQIYRVAWGPCLLSHQARVLKDRIWGRVGWGCSYLPFCPELAWCFCDGGWKIWR